MSRLNIKEATIDELEEECVRLQGTTFKEAQEQYSDTDNKKYFFETMYGDYCCQDDECVWNYIMEHEQVMEEE